MPPAATAPPIRTRRMSYEESLEEVPHHFRGDITDPVLKRQVGGFVGQEAIHGRDHRAFNRRLSQLGYPTRFLERLTERLLAGAHRVLSPTACPAATAALEHDTATLAEQLLRDEDTRALFGHDKVRELFLWRASRELWRELRNNNQPGFHPSDGDATELLAGWSEELFGADGALNDRLAEAA
ncbi:MAG: metal-dependent hydrolase [Actinomycetota bacterium]|nr:metal-dependent hydrolase [Actinomycetota bacterium]